MSAGASASEAVKEAPETSKNEPPRTIVLKGSDGQEFEVDLVMAKRSEMIKKMIDIGCVEGSVPLPYVDGPVLAKVVEYWKQHTSRKEGGDLKEWDKEFVKMPKEELFKVIMAAKYLDTSPLLDLCCQAAADTIRHMSVEDVREYFGMESDFTPEEEARIRRENHWAFETRLDED